ncbi:DUF1516 family protein [Paucilactobacillus kaifaensis]|uniref:DUF1516 family protein n=1 Tax=Paucilactobacillus kaifaensis TaxID=2559921 RepID=UPI0010F53848|nr:DUF1516 family protein [Paucilactobacillus kaifaensis]
MWTLIHLGTILLLVVTVITGLTAKSQKRIKKWMILSRIFYLLLLVTGGVILFFVFPTAPLIATLKFILAICLVILIEVSFAQKQERKMTFTLSAILSLFFILTFACGYYL